jgi:hypothetical protein
VRASTDTSVCVCVHVCVSVCVCVYIALSLCTKRRGAGGARADTTAAAMAWTMLMIALHRPVQERLQAEVDAVFASLNGADLTWGAPLCDHARAHTRIVAAESVWGAWCMQARRPSQVSLSGHGAEGGAASVSLGAHHWPGAYA